MDLAKRMNLIGWLDYQYLEGSYLFTAFKQNKLLWILERQYASADTTSKLGCARPVQGKDEKVWKVKAWSSNTDWLHRQIRFKHPIYIRFLQQLMVLFTISWANWKQ
jgi:hypothetical protein